MRRKLIMLMMVATLGMATVTGCGASKETAVTTAETEVGGAYPVPAGYAEYQLLDYYFAETDETIQLVVATNADHTEYDVHFEFFGDEQQLDYTYEDGTVTVTNDLSGFITKDAEAINAAIQESDNWTSLVD